MMKNNINQKTQEATKHTEWNCQICPRNMNAVSKQRCDLYKAIMKYYGAKACKDEITQETFKDYARAKQIIKYELGIYKELRQEVKDGEIKLNGIINDNWNAQEAIDENKSDSVRIAIIKEELAESQEKHNNTF